MTSAVEALERLRAGNQQYLAGDSALTKTHASSRSELVAEQKPFAIILGCSDSRVPAEIVFGQGLGDLFVIRVAGNIVAPSQIASVEFAAENFGTRLVVVLGHSNCGAVSATLQQLVKPSQSRSPHLSSIVSRIQSSVEYLLDANANFDIEEMIPHAVRANIEKSVNDLKHGSAILESLIAENGLQIVGAEYCLESGAVEFLNND